MSVMQMNRVYINVDLEYIGQKHTLHSLSTHCTHYNQTQIGNTVSGNVRQETIKL